MPFNSCINSCSECARYSNLCLLIVALTLAVSVLDIVICTLAVSVLDIVICTLAVSVLDIVICAFSD